MASGNLKVCACVCKTLKQGLMKSLPHGARLEQMI